MRSHNTSRLNPQTNMALICSQVRVTGMLLSKRFINPLNVCFLYVNETVICKKGSHLFLVVIQRLAFQFESLLNGIRYGWLLDLKCILGFGLLIDTFGYSNIKWNPPRISNNQSSIVYWYCHLFDSSISIFEYVLSSNRMVDI